MGDSGPDAATSPKRSGQRVVYFDFDRTLSAVHVFGRLAGMEDESSGPESRRAKVDPPNAQTERGQLRRVCELGPAWVLEAFGGPRRTASLRSLLRRLSAEPGVSLVVNSKGFVGVIKKCLFDLKMLEFFERITGVRGDCYGNGTHYDWQSLTGVALPPEVRNFLGRAEAHEFLQEAKRTTIRLDMKRRGLDLKQAIMVDDDRGEIRDAMNLVSCIHVAGSGVGAEEAETLLAFLGINPHPFAYPDLMWRVPATQDEFALSERSESHIRHTMNRAWTCWGYDARAEEEDSRGWRLSLDSLNFPTSQDSAAQFLAHPLRPSVKLDALSLLQAEDTALAGASRSGYLLTAVLGRSREGALFRARDARTQPQGKAFMVKKLSPDRIGELAKLRRFSHRNVIAVHDILTIDQRVFVVTETCKGGDLLDALRSMAECGKGLSANWCAHVFRQVVDGLCYLHAESGRGHGGICPENILFQRAPRGVKDPPRVLISDFGLSARLGKPSPYQAPELTEAGAAAGSGRHGQQQPIPCEADIWSLGAVMHLALAGEAPRLGGCRVEPPVGRWGWLLDWTHFTRRAAGRGSVAISHCASAVPPIKDDDGSAAGRKTRRGFGCCRITVRSARELLLLLLSTEVKKRPQLCNVLVHPFFNLALDLSGRVVKKQNLPAEVSKNHLARDSARDLRGALVHLVEAQMWSQSAATKEAFQETDSDGDGLLSLEDFRAFWDSISFPAGARKPTAEEIFHIVDAKGDGAIGFEEFASFRFDLLQLDEAALRQSVANAFAEISGPDHKIELGVFLDMFAGEPPSAVEALFDEVDYAGDGWVDCEELTAFLLGRCGAPAAGA